MGKERIKGTWLVIDIRDGLAVDIPHPTKHEAKRWVRLHIRKESQRFYRVEEVA